MAIVNGVAYRVHPRRRELQRESLAHMVRKFPGESKAWLWSMAKKRADVQFAQEKRQ